MAKLALLSLFVLCVSSLLLSVTGLMYAQMEAFAAFLSVFAGCIAVKFYRGRKNRRADAAGDVFVAGVHLQKGSKFDGVGMQFASIFLLSRIFEYEYGAVCKIIPYTGQVIDARRYVVRTAAVTFFAFVLAAVTAVVVVAAIVMATAGNNEQTADHLLPHMSWWLLLLLSAMIAFAPAAIPFMAPWPLSIRAGQRRGASSSEFLPFLTYASVVHTVNKTMFWVFLSINRSGMFCQLGRDAGIVLRYAKQGGMEEGASITLMAKHHPDRRLRTFLQKYASYIGTNTTRLGNYVEITREVALQDAIRGVQNYTGSANTIFFVGTMMTSVLPVMLTVMTFLPGSGVDVQSLIAVMFVLPMIFVLFPVMMSTGTMFLQAEKKIFRFSFVAGVTSFGVLYIALPHLWMLDASVGVAVFAGVNWARTAKEERAAHAADMEIPEMLDYIAEQKKAKDNMVEILQDYARLPGSGTVLQELLRGVASDIMIKSTYDAFFAHRHFPNRTIKFVFFILHAIYEHGGGTYETTIAMAHSIRRIVEIKEQFASSVRFSVGIVVLSPVVFMFSVMMTSFMTFGVPDNAMDAGSAGIAANVVAIKMTDVQMTVEALKPVSLIIAVTGGLGVSKITNYTFRQTKYLFLATAVSSVCLALWDTVFVFMQSLTKVGQ